MAKVEGMLNRRDVRRAALLIGLLALLPYPAYANLPQQVGHTAESWLFSFPAILWTLRGLAGLFGVFLLVAGFRVFTRLVTILGAAFLALLGYDLGLTFFDVGWPLAIIGGIGGATLAYTSHRACFCLVGAFPGYVLGMYWTGHLIGGIGGALITGFFTVVFFNFGIVVATSLLGALLLSLAITGHLEMWVIVYPTLMGIVIQGTTFPENIVASNAPPFVMPWRHSQFDQTRVSEPAGDDWINQIEDNVRWSNEEADLLDDDSWMRD